MKNLLKKIAVTILLILLVSSMALIFSGCNKDPVYEIKLYDDDWIELERIDGHYKPYIVEYDGTEKGVNAICYIDNEEFYRFDYKVGYGIDGPNSPLSIWCNDGSPAKERGTYCFNAEFNGFARRGRVHTTVSGRKVNNDDLPRRHSGTGVILEII